MFAPMNLKNNKIQKIISSILIVVILAPSLIVFSTPRKAEAQAGLPTTDILGNILKQINNVFTLDTKVTSKSSLILQIREAGKAVLKETLKNLARRALAGMTKSTVDWINTGFHGAPLFLENPGSFFNDIAKSEVKNLVNIIGYDSSRFPFGKSYLLGIIDSYKAQLSSNMEYSLSRVINDPAALTRYRVDFSVGGWDGLLLHSQYPQNNAIGADMQATVYLANKLKGTSQNAGDKVRDTLQQGMGFLAPQSCPSNPDYNLDYNEFNRPAFDPSSISLPDISLDPADDASNAKKLELYNSAVAASRANWEIKNTCPGGLVTLTPGSIVASTITKAMGVPQDNASLGAAFGNSLTAIFDTLLNKFLGDGLTKLSSRVNSTQEDNDNFNYYGETLGGTPDAGAGWSGIADEEVNLDKFRKELMGKTVVLDADGIAVREEVGNTGNGEYTPGAIQNTELELKLIDNPTADNAEPGLIQILDSTWPVAKSLDMCTPGPNKNWEKKLDGETERIISAKIITETGNEDSLKVKAARDAIRELRFAVKSFKDWINTRMIEADPQKGGLPGAILFIDAIKELDTNDQQYRELTDKKRAKGTAVARLNSIYKALEPFTTQPKVGSPEEKNLISIRKQYNAIASSISSSASLEELQSQLDLAKERKQNLLLLENQCNQERVAAKWTAPGLNGSGRLPSAAGQSYFFFETRADFWGGEKRTVPGPTITSSGTEKEVFCDVPIVNGYSHGEIIRKEFSNDQGALLFTFRNGFGNNLGTPGFTDLPMVNAHEYYGDKTEYFPVSVEIDCRLLFKTNDIEYKQAGDESF